MLPLRGLSGVCQAKHQGSTSGAAVEMCGSEEAFGRSHQRRSRGLTEAKDTESLCQDSHLEAC
eukprot:363847-Chlamydomonas_euryale.AAC.6